MIVTAEQAEALTDGKSIKVVVEMEQPPEGYGNPIIGPLGLKVLFSHPGKVNTGHLRGIWTDTLPHPVGSTVRMKYIDMVDRVSIHTAKVTDVRVMRRGETIHKEARKYFGFDTVEVLDEWVAVTTLERRK